MKGDCSGSEARIDRQLDPHRAECRVSPVVSCALCVSCDRRWCVRGGGQKQEEDVHFVERRGEALVFNHQGHVELASGSDCAGEGVGGSGRQQEPVAQALGDVVVAAFGLPRGDHRRVVPDIQVSVVEPCGVVLCWSCRVVCDASCGLVVGRTGKFGHGSTAIGRVAAGARHLLAGLATHARVLGLCLLPGCSVCRVHNFLLREKGSMVIKSASKLQIWRAIAQVGYSKAGSMKVPWSLYDAKTQSLWPGLLISAVERVNCRLRPDRTAARTQNTVGGQSGKGSGLSGLLLGQAPRLERTITAEEEEDCAEQKRAGEVRHGAVVE